MTNTWEPGINSSELVFISNEQEQKFLKACADSINAKEQEKNSKVKNATNDFSF